MCLPQKKQSDRKHSKLLLFKINLDFCRKIKYLYIENDTQLRMFEWCRKNINAVEFILVSHEEVGSHIVDYGLEERYLMWSTVPGTSFHWYKPCSKTSFQMWHVSSDDVTILHRKSSIQKATVMDDCQPGKYIACVYDKEWFLGIILMTWEENQDVEVKFLMKSTQNHFNWLCMLGTNQPCFMPNLLVHVDTVNLKRNLIISWNCLRNFQFEYFILLNVFHYNNLTAVLKFQVSNYTLF